MIYFIQYTLQDNTDVVLFDIEYFMKKEEGDLGRWDDKLWYSEIHPLACVDGLTRFLKEKFQEPNFDSEDFIKDAHQIEELRGLLYETYDNRLKTFDDAEQFHNQVFMPKLKQILDDFCNKWGLYLDID